jgi:uncharacterized protein YjgD (DUF1641 family)
VTSLDDPLDVTLDDSRSEVARLEAKIDRLTDHVEVLTREAELQARQRESWDEFRRDATVVAGEALAIATHELDDLVATADLADTVRLLRRLVEVAPTLDRALVALSQLGELVDDAAPLGVDVMTMLTDRLALAEQKGYIDFARAGARVADRVVTGFDADDLDHLGDSIVEILGAVREITQPELLALLGRMVNAVRFEQEVVKNEPSEPPSLWSLARQSRDPDVRRGMARALETLRAVSRETGPAFDTATDGSDDTSQADTSAADTPTQGDIR